MSQKQYDPILGEYGFTGESRFRQYIRSCGYNANKHPHGKYREDVEYVSDSEKFFADIERRTERTWKGDAWPNWRTIHILARRGTNPGTLFFTMSADMTKALVSFANDLRCISPSAMTNCHASDEPIRDHEIMRCLRLDLTAPITGSLASMNADRVRGIVKNCNNYTTVMRTLKGVEPHDYGAPYGIDDEEWREMLIDVEQRSGLAWYAARPRQRQEQKTLCFD